MGSGVRDTDQEGQKDMLCGADIDPAGDSAWISKGNMTKKNKNGLIPPTKNYQVVRKTLKRGDDMRGKC